MSIIGNVLAQFRQLNDADLPDSCEYLIKTTTRPPGSTATVTAWGSMTPARIYPCRVSTPRAAPPEVLAAGAPTALPPERVVTLSAGVEPPPKDGRLRITFHDRPDVLILEVTEYPAPASIRVRTTVRGKVASP